MPKTIPAALALTTLLAGCAITSSHDRGPGGQPVHFIDAMSAGTAYRKAQELCPGGYMLIGEPRLISVMDYVMTIECKPPRLAPAVPPPASASASTPKAGAPAARGAVGQDEYVAGQAARAAACATRPEPRLLATEPGAETYSVACDAGGVLLLRCEYGNCRPMK